MKSFQTILQIALLLFMGCSVFAQSNKKNIADKTYEELGYSSAINTYLSSLGKDENAKMDRKSMIRLANSFRLIGDSQNAEKWYSQIVESSNKPLYRLYYAQALQSNGNCELARKYYLEYHEMMVSDSTNIDFDQDGKLDLRGRTLAEGCDMEFADQQEVTFENLAAINSEKLDFSPAYYRNGIVFATNQNIFGPRSNTDLWINDDFLDLYFTAPEDDVYSKPVPFSNGVNTRFHEGQITFDQAGVTMFFTRNNFNGKRGKDRRGVTKLKIYSADWNGSEWTNIREFPFNHDQRSLCHPTLSADGMNLYFASDSKAKGYGGMDLYVSKFTDGRWGKPRNLGPEVNTRGNEVFPFAHEDGSLYFSSNGHAGMGGLDVYTTKYVEVGDTSVWSRPQNLGQPYNSKKDDFGFIVDTRKRSGYMSSNRPGGKGGDDIYKFKIPPGSKLELDDAPLIEWNAKLLVVDDSDNTPLKDAEIRVAPCGGSSSDGFIAKLIPVKGKDNEFMLRILNGTIDEDAEKMTTNKDGEAYYGLSSNKDYCFYIEREGYEPAEAEFSTKEYSLDREINIEIPMEKKPECMEISGTVTNKVYKALVPNAKIKIVNKFNGEVEELTSDKKGNFATCIPCDAEFEIRGNKDEVGMDTTMISSLGRGCKTAKTLKMELEMPPPPPKPAIDPAMEAIRRNPPPPYSINQKVIMENIFYDYNKDNVRPESYRDLNRLVEIMNTYPSLVVEIAAHTDARGSKAYNQALSQRRAEKTVQYLRQQGVPAVQLSARGYGEIDPVVVCPAGRCSEAEHQLNRRTEFKVLQILDNVDIRGMFENGF